MKLVLLKSYLVIFTCLSILPMIAGSASAHRVNVFAWVEDDSVHVAAKFAGGKKVKTAKIFVMDSQGTALLSDSTNDEGEYSFRVPGLTDLRIVVSAGQGHQGEWTIRAAELKDLPFKTGSDSGSDKAAQPESIMTASRPPDEPHAPVTDLIIKPEELEAVIESALDRKLKPIIRTLAEQQQEGPNARDIFAGIGYITGLVGIAAYFHNRKKKD